MNTGLDCWETKDLFKELISYLKLIERDDLRNFINEIFAINEHLFKIAPAAVKHHHNYKGGLLVHTLECVKLAIKCLDELNYDKGRDDIIAACILHDIGKMYEYGLDTESGEIVKNQDFYNRWTNHTHYGYILCMNKGFVNVAKMIAAHHGRTDWGAIFDLSSDKLSPEHCIVHLVDMMSCRFGRISL